MVTDKQIWRDKESFNITHNNATGGASEKILEEMENLLADKPDYIIIHARTNDITNGISSLNSVEKIVKNVRKSSPNTEFVFSNILLRKDKKDISKRERYR